MTLCCIFFSMPRSMFAEILAQVRRVPRGKVATYGDIAYAAGYPGSARQVAWALHTSSSGLPWHRIVGADGKILLPGEAGFHRHSFFTKEKSRKEKSAKKSITAAQRRYKNARHDGAGK
jgi:alkylated DNA nucleotide flippase Atl1